MQESYQKARGQAKTVRYPQPESILADVFSKGGNEINDYSPYGKYNTWTSADINKQGEQLGQSIQEWTK